MKILITNFFYLKNNGDAAILSVLLSQLKIIFNGPPAVIVITDSVEDNKDFENTPLVESFFYLAVYTTKNQIARILKTLYIIFSTTLWAIIYKYFNVKADAMISKKSGELLSEYLKSELVIAAGGGYILGDSGVRGNITVVLQLHAIYIAHLLGKPVILYSQSIGPLGNWFQKFLTKKVLNLSRGILCREQLTVDYLKDLGVKKDLVYKTVDAAFLFNPGTKEKMAKVLGSLGIGEKNKKIGITVRNWFGAERQSLFESEIAGFVDYLVKRQDASIIFIPQVVSTLHNDDDRVAAARIRKKIISQKNVWFLEQEFNHSDIKGIYENLDYVVGTRMHSNIFSLTSKVPVIAIQYLHKTEGIMKDLGLYEWVIKIEEVTGPRLIFQFEKLMANREEYLSVLNGTLPVYLEKAREAALIIKELA